MSRLSRVDRMKSAKRCAAGCPPRPPPEHPRPAPPDARPAASGASQAVSGRAVVADFDGGSVTSDAGALLLGQATRGLGRSTVLRLVSSIVAMVGSWSIRFGRLRVSVRSGLRWATRTRSTTTRCAAIRLWRLLRGNRRRTGWNWAVCLRPGTARSSMTDRQLRMCRGRCSWMRMRRLRSGRFRVSTRRTIRFTVRRKADFPRPLRLLSLLAAGRFVRSPPSGVATASDEHRRRSQGGEGGGADRGPVASALAGHADRVASRFGIAREELMAWREANDVDSLFGLARNDRLAAQGADALAEAEADSRESGAPARRFAGFMRSTRDSRAANAASSARPNGPMARPIRASSSPRSPPARMAPGAPMRTSTASAARWRPASRAPTRPVRRPRLGAQHARQPTLPAVRVDGLCAALRPAPPRPRPHPPRRRRRLKRRTTRLSLQ